MLIWFAETTLVASILAAVALLGGRWRRIGPVGRHALWLVVLVKFVVPPIVCWPRPAILASDDARDPERPRPSTRPEAVGAELTPGGRGEGARAADASPFPPAAPAPVPPPGAGPGIGPIPLDLSAIGRAVPIAWAAATAAIVLSCGYRIARFRRHLKRALPPPRWFEDEARLVARSLGVRVPEILVIPATTTPMLWCLGRPRLLLPGRLVETLGEESWRGILAHELAHLRRRDHWVRRLELLAGLFWWWNPLYWLTLGRLEAEAELACDECAVRAFPDGRLAYAEALLKVCQSLSPAVSPAPALGAAGSGRFLERRVTMILRDPAPSRASTPALFGAALLSLVAIPGWSAPGSAVRNVDGSPAAASQPVRIELVLQDDEDERVEAKARAKARSESQRRSSRSAEDEALKEKELAERGERIAREMEKKLGPGSDFQKRMEAFGEEMAKKFGPDSDFAKRIEKQFGPDSEFAKRIEKQFGPDSEFAKEMEKKFGPESEFAKEMEKKFGPESEFAKAHKELKFDDKLEKKSDKDDRKTEDKRTTGRTTAPARKPVKPTNVEAARRSKERQIEAIRRQLEQLSKQLRALQEDDEDR